MDQLKKVENLVLMIAVWFTIIGRAPNGMASDIKEEVKKGVVKITVEKPGNVIETGAGIVLATKRQAIFILTAYHVIDEAQKITVTFYEYPAEKFAGELFEKYDEEKDLAVVYIRSSAIPKEIPKLYLGDVSKINELDKVIAIGHPSSNEWELSTAEVRSTELSQFRFSGDAVHPGNSGGALLNEQLQLIGLVIKKHPRDGFALKIDDALEILRKWKIPYEFKGRSKKWPFFVAGGVGVGVASYFRFRNGNGEQGFPDPLSPRGGN